LPKIIRTAVEEVVGFVKAPIPLVASSALAALSLAIQAHADIKRAEMLHGTTGLFLLTIADSGERKSTCDGFFTQAIREYESAKAEIAQTDLKRYNAQIGAWEAKQVGVKDKIRNDAKNNKSTTQMENNLQELEMQKPEPPKIPRLLYTDVTPEALAYSFASQWPSGGVVSAEAGIVFGSHSMGKDSVMRNLSLLNQLWDGASLKIDRRTSESFTVKGARLTVALQVQEPTLREFFNKTGSLARGTGFMARFLVSWPRSTQGMRPFTEAPKNWPALVAFNQRLAAILNQEMVFNENILSPTLMTLSEEAKQSWVKYHDTIESELNSDGQFFDVCDVASKSADNAARLATLFQVFEHGMSPVSLDCFDSASKIALRHLNESRRFFGELALPTELADAVRLDEWLLEYCKSDGVNNVRKNHVRQYGPLRQITKLNDAITELVNLDRIQLLDEGKRKSIKVNPAPW
jgi:putative DNA primase/helicase